MCGDQPIEKTLLASIIVFTFSWAFIANLKQTDNKINKGKALSLKLELLPKQTHTAINKQKNRQLGKRYVMHARCVLPSSQYEKV